MSTYLLWYRLGTKLDRRRGETRVRQVTKKFQLPSTNNSVEDTKRH